MPSFYRCAVLLALGHLATSIPLSPAYDASDSAASVLAGLGVNLSRFQNSSNMSTNGGDASVTCAVLHFLFPRNETFTPGSSYYEPLYEIPWSQTCWLTPGCVVTPNDAKDLSITMKVLTALKTKFAVRSGGHKDAPGFNGVDRDGVLIALQNLNQLKLSADTKTLTVGPGNRWAEVYTFVEDYGVSVVGGRQPSVGVGGFLLGGGLGFFNNDYGLGLDQVIRFRVVLTNGRIVDATSTEHADLYQALKGGMTNFGIVAEFDLMTNPYLHIYYEVQAYSIINTPALLKAYAEHIADPASNPKSSVQLQLSSNITLAFYGYEVQTNDLSAFEKFRSIPVLKTVIPPHNGTVTELAIAAGSATSPGSLYGSAYSHKLPNADFLLESYQTYLATAAEIPSDWTLIWVPQGINAGLVDAGKARNGGNKLGLSATPQAWIDIFINFPSVNQSTSAAAIVDGFVRECSQKAESLGLLLPYIYPNNANAKQKPLSAYGADNFETIRNVARKYDPRGYMQTLQNNGFLISKEIGKSE